MSRRSLRTAARLSLALCAAGVGWWVLCRALRPRVVSPAGGRCLRGDFPRPACVDRPQGTFSRLIPSAAAVTVLLVARSLRARRCRRRGGHQAERPAAVAPGYALSRWIFLRLLGVVYLAAFVSLWVQIKGLVGRRGILPVADYLDEVRRLTGPERYRLVPTLCWLDASDRGLDRLCAGGVLLSCLLILNVAPAPIVDPGNWTIG